MKTGTGKSAFQNNRREKALLPELTELAVKGLEVMFEDVKQLFCHRAIRTEKGIMNEGTSVRYTIISLLGLHQREANGKKPFLDIQNAVAALFQHKKEIENIGDVGLLIWLCAMASPPLLPRIWSEFRIKDTLTSKLDALQGRTMELSWFLTGLAYAKLRQAEGIRGLSEAADSTFHRLMQNYEVKGLFRHMGRSSPTGLIRGRIGNFADQVYPIYALSKFSCAFGSERALHMAYECAKTICNLQGDYGQWWWHYDAATGRVIGRYPVYSVHQDGMAPMALSAVGEATGIDFRESIYKGMRWIEGNNELGVSMIDPERKFIWRCFERDPHKLFASVLFSLANHSDREKEYKDLKIRYECRSYHLGWLLYALENRSMITVA